MASVKKMTHRLTAQWRARSLQKVPFQWIGEKGETKPTTFATRDDNSSDHYEKNNFFAGANLPALDPRIITAASNTARKPNAREDDNTRDPKNYIERPGNASEVHADTAFPSNTQLRLTL